MAKDLETKLVLNAVDNASKVVKDAAKNTEKALKETERAAQQSGNSQTQAAQQAANATVRSNKNIEQSYHNARKVAADVTKFREVLGVRSENAIQRELEQTRAAYDRLKRSGVASQNELRRASEATKKRVQELNAELGKTSFADKAANVGRGIMKAGVGVATGVAIAAPKVMATAEYDLALARVADTGYSGESIEEKTKAKSKIHRAIRTTITEHGGTKEDALASLNELMSKGKVSVEDGLALLPTIQKNATATGASSAELTEMVNSMLNFGVKQSEIQSALDYMNASGKAGGFELKDMAQYFPQILANAGGSGLSGLEDLKKVGVQLQQVYDVSGGASETATNMNNFYSKVKASSTQKNIEKLEFKNPKTGKTQSIDMKASMEKYIKEGQNAGEALLSIIGDILKNDNEYQAMLKQVKAAKGEDKKAIMSKIAKYLEGSKVAEIMPDLQAGLATYAMMNGSKVKENVHEQYALADKGNYNEESYQFIKEQNATRIQIAKNHKEMGEIETLQKVGDITADVLSLYADFATEFPNLNTALVTATEAVKTFGAALAASSLMDLLISTGKGGKGSLASSVIDLATSRKGVKWGIGGLAATSIGLGLYAAAEHRNAVAAKSESEQEKHSEAIKQFHQANTPKTTPTFRYGVPSATPMPTMQYHGGYVIADRLQSNEVGKERVKQGSLSLEELKARNERNQNIIQGVIKPQVDSVTQTLSTYQADFQAFGQTISAGIEAGLASQSHTIANQITVELDGSVVAEKVAQYQFNFNKRMA